MMNLVAYLTLFTNIALVAISLSLILIGVMAILFPLKSSLMFGIKADSGNAISFVRSLGARDIAIGVIGAYCFFTLPIFQNIFFVSSVAFFSASDAVITYRAKSKWWIMHAIATAMLLGFSVFLFYIF